MGGSLLSNVPFLFDELPTTTSRGAKDMRPKVPYERMHKIPASLKDNERRGFRVSTSEKPWIFNRGLTSYCCDRRAQKDMSSVRRRGTLYPCNAWFGCMDDIISLAYGDTKYEKDMCNSYRKLKAFLDEDVKLQRKRLKNGACKIRRQSDTALQN